MGGACRLSVHLKEGVEASQRVRSSGRTGAGILTSFSTCDVMKSGSGRPCSSISRVDLRDHPSLGNLFMNPKQIIQAFVDAINSQDWIKLDSRVAPDFVRHSIAAGEPPVRSRTDLVSFFRREYQTFPDAQEMVLDIFAEGEKVAVRHHFRGVQHGAMGSYPPSGKTMNTEYIAIYRVRNGQILEVWVEWDNFAGLRQLGHL